MMIIGRLKLIITITIVILIVTLTMVMIIITHNFNDRRITSLPCQIKQHVTSTFVQMEHL